MRPIALLAFGLVLANALLAAFTAQRLIGLPWALAFALGAVLSPTDPAAASTIAPRAGIPARLTAILEGEGLVNDALALTLLRLAATAAATGHFSFQSGAVRFLAIVVGEPLYGWLVGVAVMFLRSHIFDPRLEITITLLTPFAAYLAPEYLGGSGILAAMAAGMYVGARRADIVPAGTRLHASSVWETVEFLLNGALFMMAGVELQRVVHATANTLRLFEYGLAIACILIVLGALWCALMWAFFRGGKALLEEGERRMPGRHMAVIAWSGMRGPISPAATLSIPLSVPRIAGGDFQTMLFITAVVIAVTLVPPGIGLIPIVRGLHVSGDAAREQSEDERQFAFGEAEAARAAIEQLVSLETEGRISRETAGKIREDYEDRLSEIESGTERQPVLLVLIEAERARIERLRAEGRINDRVTAELERLLDLRQSALRRQTAA